MFSVMFLYWNGLKISQNVLYCLQNVNSTKRNPKLTLTDLLIKCIFFLVWHAKISIFVILNDMLHVDGVLKKN